ncbi:meprin A subunit alpha [Kryptolebias marmoratus]|uniref:Meprin A subunit n=1 Tax=Kryptolebias marmoratus TaxID=37003 RepID=A0A3Q3BL93_KRYMA|nr:meprin A subunit alpha [Kryptolebias marmoratus]
MASGGTLRKIVALIGVFAILKVQAAPTITDDTADEGELRDDIPEINRELKHLFEGDIAGNPSRNAILDQTRRWKFPIPYILTDSLDLNAKGVILQAFEEYRLRSCVDFKPYEGETSYISFTKLSGCWSYVGDDRKGQNVSIGERCDTKAIVEHELLHALGFYHEQSRSDRDDYVQIWWDQIEDGKEHNFNKYEDDFITDLNTAYDYESIMHYRPLSFNKNVTIPTITTSIPYFNDVIGQRMDFSAVDITRLNRMYDCANTHTLLDQCSFEQINICGMIQNEEDNADWDQTLSTPSDVDHTLAGRCRDSGYFMKFDTSSGAVGRSALLESRILYPKRDEQCLQFFYKMTGAAGDKLVLWIKIDDGTGSVRNVRKIHTITGDGDDAWKIAHVPLKVTEKFRYFFQGIRGSSTSSGAILIDDIALTETVCPSLVWQIHNFSGVLTTTPTGTPLKSKCFYNSEGYSFSISVYPNGTQSDYSDYVGIFIHLCSGENDAVMQWPVKNRQATVIAVDQDPDVKLRMSSTRSFTTDANTRWNKPTAASGAVWDDDCRCFRSSGYGWSTFISHNHLQRRSFLKNNDLILTADFSDLTHLINTEVPVKPAAQSPDLTAEKTVDEVEMKHKALKQREARAVSPCDPNMCLNGGVCVEIEGKAACRCATSQATFYTGPRCENMNINRGILGAFIGGTAGTVVLTLAIFTVIRRTQTNGS